MGQGFFDFYYKRLVYIDAYELTYKFSYYCVISVSLCHLKQWETRELARIGEANQVTRAIIVIKVSN